MGRFTDLKVWRLGHSLALEVYRVSSAFPDDERYGVRAQLRRAAVSVPTNIAEGSKRSSRPDYARFLNMAEGSLAETNSLLLISRDLGYLRPATVDTIERAIDRLSAMLHKLRESVEQAHLYELATRPNRRPSTVNR